MRVIYIVLLLSIGFCISCTSEHEQAVDPQIKVDEELLRKASELDSKYGNKVRYITDGSVETVVSEDPNQMTSMEILDMVEQQMLDFKQHDPELFELSVAMRKAKTQKFKGSVILEGIKTHNKEQ